MSNAMLMAKLLFSAGLVALVVVVFGTWYYYGVEISLIILLVVCFALIIGTLIISKRKKNSSKTHTNIEESEESMLRSNNAEISQRLASVNYISDDSMVLEQSHFTPPQVVNAVVENSTLVRDSIMSNNEVPPSYEEAKTMPTV